MRLDREARESAKHSASGIAGALTLVVMMPNNFTIGYLFGVFVMAVLNIAVLIVRGRP